MNAEDTVTLFGILHAAYGRGPRADDLNSDRREEFVIAVRTWQRSLHVYPLDDVLDALEVMLNGGQDHYPNLTQMIEGVQSIRRNRALAGRVVDPDTGEITSEPGIPWCEPRAQAALRSGYVQGKMHQHGITREAAEQLADESEVLRPWLVSPATG